jgi:hypothetical protein
VRSTARTTTTARVAPRRRRRSGRSAHARLRFVVVLGVLLALAIFLMLTIWHEGAERFRL